MPKPRKLTTNIKICCQKIKNLCAGAHERERVCDKSIKQVYLLKNVYKSLQTIKKYAR